MSDLEKIFNDLEKQIFQSFKGILDTDKNWDRLFNLSAHLPKASVREQNNNVYVTVDLPKLTKDHQLKLSLIEDYLVIQGSLEKEQRVTSKSGGSISESRSEYLYKTIPLPVRVARKGAKATYKNGKLEVILKKTGELAEWNSDINIDYK